MKVLGISGRAHDAAAALAVDGRVVSAATEDSFARVPGIGYALTGGFPFAAVQACLDAAQVGVGDLDRFVIVGEDTPHPSLPPFPSRPTFIPETEADASQVAMSAPASSAVVVCSAQPAALAVFDRSNGNRRRDIIGAGVLVDGARQLSDALGVRSGDPFAALDRLSIGADPEFQSEIAQTIRWDTDALHVQPAELVATARRVAGDHADALSDPHSLNTRAQQARRAIAASFTVQLATVVAQVADRTGGADSAVVGVGGSAFANPRFNTELQRLTGRDLSFAPVPEAFGRALGAVAAGEPVTSHINLALGPSFSEEEIKRTLDTCRLDYVYEPDWKRLLGRVSRMLGQGKVVAWFHGAMAFGPRAMGTRSILCDPSNRYARQNLNEYLRQVPLDEPLPVVIAPSQVERCLSAPEAAAQRVVDAQVNQEWRQSLSAALDWRQAVRVHGGNHQHVPQLVELLEMHFASTGTPGLIETNLAGPGEAVACTPRDAVRTVYSSAVDALVIGRFLLMKDYWLLRAHE